MNDEPTINEVAQRRRRANSKQKWIIVLTHVPSGVEYYFPPSGTIDTPRWTVNLDKAFFFSRKTDAAWFFQRIKRQYAQPDLARIEIQKRVKPE